jgi:hypothetical protein
MNLHYTMLTNEHIAPLLLIILGNYSFKVNFQHVHILYRWPSSTETPYWPWGSKYFKFHNINNLWCTQFQISWLCLSKNIFHTSKLIFTISKHTPLLGHANSFQDSWISFPRRYFMPSLVEIPNFWDRQQTL